MKPPSPLADEATRQVLGCGSWLRGWRPDSERGEALARAPRPWRPGEREAWAAELEARRDAGRWLEDAAPEDLSATRRALAELPSLEGPRRRLRADESLREADLFAIKRLLYHARALCELAASLLAREHPVERWRASIDTWLARIHPEPEPTPRFTLDARLAEGLAEARQARRQARRAAHARRRAVEDELRERYPGARFGVRGGVTLPDPEARARAGRDPALTAHGRGWRPTDKELARLQARLEEAERLLEQTEARVRANISAALMEVEPWLGQLEDALVDLDLRLACARWRRDQGACWPQWRPEAPGARLEAGRDPASSDPQPISVSLRDRPLVLTGPNMGGKSTLLRTLGLCQWCLQHALPVPAAAFEAAAVEAITYIGSDEPGAASLQQGLSAFGHEIRRIVLARRAIRAPSLWLLDEVGRGTHPTEGAALAREIVASLHADGHRVCAATHFPALAQLPGADRWRIRGLTGREALGALAQTSPEDPGTLERALRAAMDYRPEPLDEDDDDAHEPVPRDARLVARLLGWRASEEE